MIAFLTTADMFGVRPNINLKGYYKSYSNCGLFLTALVGIIFLWAAIYFSISLFERKDPTLIQSSISEGLTETIKFDSEIKIAFGLQDSVTKEFYQDESIYTAEGLLFSTGAFSHSGKDEYIPLKVEPCYSDMLKGTFGLQGKLWCLSLKQEEGVNIEISTFEKIYPLILFKTCDSTKPGNTCASQAEIETKLKKSWFVVFSIDYVIDPNDYANPIKSEWRADWFTIIPTLGKIVDFYLQSIIFTTDTGMLFSQQNMTSFIAVDKIENDLGDTVITEGSFFTVDISTRGRKILYDRKYKKLQSMLADIVGIINAVVMVLRILGTQFFHFKMYEGLINEAFDAERKKLAKKKKRELLKALKLKKASTKNNSPLKYEIGQKMISEATKENIEIAYNPVRYSLETNQLEKINTIIKGPSKEALSQLKMSDKDKAASDYHISVEPTKIQQTSSDIYRNRESLIITPNAAEFEKKTSPVMKGEEPMSSGLELPPEVEHNLKKGKYGGDARKKYNEISPEDVNVGYFQWILSFIKSNQNVKIVNRVQQQIKAELDINTLFKKLAEIDRLKYLLLTKEQKILFDNLHRPLFEVAMRSRASDDTWKKSFLGYQDITEEAYNTLKAKPEKTLVDDKLLWLYEKTLS